MPFMLFPSFQEGLMLSLSSLASLMHSVLRPSSPASHPLAHFPQLHSGDSVPETGKAWL